MSFLINATRGEVGNSLELVLAHVDLETRRVIPFGDDVAGSLDAEIERHDRLGWTASISRLLRIGVPGR
jgi:acyl-CoA thioester hydrolase